VAVGAGLLLAGAIWLVPPRLARAIQAHIEREAARRGLRARVEAVAVGLWPPLALSGLRLESPQGWSLNVDSIEIGLRLRGNGLLGRTRVALGRVTLRAPAGLAVQIVPSRWDIAATRSGLRAELREGGPGLAIEWLGPAARLEARATGLPAGRFFAVERGGAPLLDAGVWEGEMWLENGCGATAFDLDLRARDVRLAALSGGEALNGNEAPAFGQPSDVALWLGGSWRAARGALDVPGWRLKTAAATFSGSLALSNWPGDPHVRLALQAERVDFARLLGASGLDQPEALAVRFGGPARVGELGSASLSARVSGRLAEPASFSVSQRVDFVPPRRPLPALERLRGDFAHEVVLAAGGRASIAVSAESADFISLPDVPPLFVRTLLLGEDAGFFSHRGVDLQALPQALLANSAGGGALRGASTITQQLAKNLFLSRERRLGRKLQELCLALLLEATLSKQRILEIYLNVIEWGPGLYGLRPATRRYFGKEPWELTPKQMTFLVALIPGPVKYQRSFADGTLSPGFSSLMQKLLAKLRSVDALSQEQYQAALAEEIVVGPPAAPEDSAAAR